MKSRCRCQAPRVDAVIPSHQSCQSAQEKKRVPWLSALLSALTARLSACWHWMTLPRRWRGGGRVAVGEERCLSEHRYSLRLSLLGHPPKSLPRPFLDISEIGSWASVFMWCVPPPPPPSNAPYCQPCCWLPPFLPTFNSATNIGRKKEFASHHTDSHSAKSKQPCQKNAKSLPLTHHGNWQGRINRGRDSPYSSSS